MSSIETILNRNLEKITTKIAQAADRAGRDADSIRLVAVTKYVDAEIIRALFGAGCRDFGESRPQVLWEKAEQLQDLKINWHLVGHLQRNKVKRTLDKVDLIHSVDSLRLLETINEESKSKNLRTNVLLEVNISGDEAKHGFKPDEIGSYFKQISTFENILVKGLMSMASLQGGTEQARKDFRAMRDLHLQLKENLPPGIELNELSMGMSRDFEVAIEHGATMVRVGSALFEGLDRLSNEI